LLLNDAREVQRGFFGPRQQPDPRSPGARRRRSAEIEFASFMSEALVLRRPRPDEEDEFMRAHRATSPDVPYFLHYYEEGMSFRRYIEVLEERERGVNLPPGHVASTFLFAFT